MRCSRLRRGVIGGEVGISGNRDVVVVVGVFARVVDSVVVV